VQGQPRRAQPDGQAARLISSPDFDDLLLPNPDGSHVIAGN
jgi:hypothetical protein